MIEGFKISLLTVGKARHCPEQALFDHYARRLACQLVVREVEAGRKLPSRQARDREGGLLLAALPKGAKSIALDEGGRALTSQALADLLAQWRLEGQQELAFFIGGADGLSPAVRSAADRVIAFGPATWPHLLVRALLAEQLYRAQTILQGHPYHRA